MTEARAGREGWDPGLQPERTTLAVLRTTLVLLVETVVWMRVAVVAHPHVALVLGSLLLVLPVMSLLGLRLLHARHVRVLARSTDGASLAWVVVAGTSTSVLGLIACVAWLVAA